MKIRLADYIANTLAEAGIEDCFMVTGGGAMHLDDAFGHHKKINCLYNHHEQACAIAAEGYARIKDKPAVVLVTTGPGGANALNGVLGAYLDSIPMIIISGQVRYDTTARYNNQFTNGHKLRSFGDQEFDITTATKAMCKYAVMLEDPFDIKYILEKALYLVNNGRPGPVWLDIPLNFQSMMIETDELRGYSSVDEEKDFTELDDELLENIINKIKIAKRPIFYPGYGIRLAEATKVFEEVVNKLNIPVCTYWDAIDLIESDNPLYVGRAGNMGDRPGNFAVQNADLLLVIGNRLSIRNVGYNYKAWARGAEVIMVDIDEAELNKASLHVDMKIHNDAKVFLEALNKKMNSSPISNKEDWIKQCQLWKEKYPVVSNKHYEDEVANVYAAFDYISRNLREGSITVTSNGSCCVAGHQSWFIKEGSRFLNNNANATMGYGLPASIGASIANNKKEVICLEGDGSIMMNLQELQTIITNKLPIKIVLINNDGYHSMRQTQSKFFNDKKMIGVGPDSNDLSFPSYEIIAYAFGYPYYKATTNKELKESYDAFMKEESYAILEIFVSKEQFFEPKNDAKQLEDGSLVSPPLEDLYPFLPKEELEENMYIDLVEYE